MSDKKHLLNVRLLDLLATKVTQGLSATEQAEFDQFEWAAQGLDSEMETQRFETAATAFDQAFVAGESETIALPPNLRDKLLVSAGEFFATPDPVLNSDMAGPDDQVVVRRSVVAAPSWRETISILAAVACLLLLFGALSGLFSPFETGPIPAIVQLEKFEANPPADMVEIAWTNLDENEITGRVYWSDQRQEGYMVFDGLPVNDSSKEQYQLWIFDTDVAQEVPIDGGVFDIVSSGKVVVPISAQHPVGQAVMFAVTIEQPGGVQRSDRERLPLLAKVEK